MPAFAGKKKHAIGVARDEAVQPFVQLSSIAEIQQWVRQQAQSTPQDEWIQIPRIDLTRLREGRLPTRSELDAATAEHPVVFNWQYGSRQIQVLNTAALPASVVAQPDLLSQLSSPANSWVKRTPLLSTPVSPRLGYEGACV